jgi:hypothetical protein
MAKQSTPKPQQTPQKPTKPPTPKKKKDCREPFLILREVPVAVIYAVVAKGKKCPPPVIGDVSEALKDKAREYCAKGECEKGKCEPANVLVTINKQLGTFTRSRRDGRTECWIVIEAEMSTRCICQ